MSITRWFAVAVSIVLSSACEVGTRGPHDPGGGDDGVDVDGAAPTGDPDAAAAIDAPAGPQPGDGVVWTTWPAQQARSNPAWGAALTDIANHLPASYGDQYWDSDPNTAGHETTHGIQAHLRNYLAPAGPRTNALYVLGDRAAFVVEPNLTKSQIVPFVPASLRGPRFATYLTGQTEWDDTPLYVWDEWNAYCNGAEVSIDLESHHLWTLGWQDAVMGPLEFVAYALASGMAVQADDPAYFASNTQFKEVLAWEVRRAMTLFRTGRTMTDFAWADQDAYYDKLRQSSDADALRRFARDTYGAAWTSDVLGF